MNKDIAQGSWTEIKAKIKGKWAKLTDSDIDAAQSNLESIKGKIQKTYGYAKEKAEQEYMDFKKSIQEKPKGSKA